MAGRIGTLAVHHFCTYFDHRYLKRGLALYESLQEHSGDFTLWVLCLSQQCHKTLLQINKKNIRIISLDELERYFPQLLAAKHTRTLIEYYFTLTPALPLFILKQFSDIPMVTYCDADIFFFSNPEVVFSEIGKSSIALIEHRFPPHLRHLVEFGRFNVGWISFRNDLEGLRCLRWYYEKCLECCSDLHTKQAFADQKYLDDVPTLFTKVHVIQHSGANVAPWNVDSFLFSYKNHIIFVGDQPLIFYHFHGLRRFGPIFIMGLHAYKARSTVLFKKEIYIPYLRKMALLHLKSRHCRLGSLSRHSYRGNKALLGRTIFTNTRMCIKAFLTGTVLFFWEKM